MYMASLSENGLNKEEVAQSWAEKRGSSENFIGSTSEVEGPRGSQVAQFARVPVGRGQVDRVLQVGQSFFLPGEYEPMLKPGDLVLTTPNAVTWPELGWV